MSDYNILVWGTGKISKNLLSILKLEEFDSVNIVAFVDNSVENKGNLLNNKPVILPKEICNFRFEKIVIATKYYKEIQKQIENDLNISLDLVVSSKEFTDEISLKFWKGKNVCFYGDRYTFEIYETIAKYFFSSYSFVEKNIKNSSFDNYDSCLICPPRYISDEEVELYENECLKIISEKNCKKYKEWRHLFSINIKIGNGNLNPDKLFYLIKVSDPISAWGNMLPDILRSISYAYENEMIPVIDMKNFNNQYLSVEKFGIENAWNYYFEQLETYSLEEVYNSCNVILSGIYSSVSKPYSYKLLRKKSKVDKYIEDYYHKLFPSEEKVLGVVYRGTDYYSAYNHPHPMNEHDFISTVKKYMDMIDYKYVFIATEIEEMISLFKKEFGNKALYTDQQRYKASERRLLYKVHFDRDNDEYQKGLEYLTVLELLARCNSILGIPSATVKLAELMKASEYEHCCYDFEKYV